MSEISLDSLDAPFALDSISAYGLEPQPIVSAGYSSSDTLAPAKGRKAVESAKPQIAPPSYLLFALELEQIEEEIAIEHLSQAKKNREKEKKKFEEIDKQKLEEVQRYSSAVATQQTWGAWSTIAQYVATGSQLVLGISLLSAGGGAAAGGYVIAAGVLGMGNRVLSDLGAHHWLATCFAETEENQRKISEWIDWSAMMVSLGLGAAGGIMAYQTGAFALAAQASKDSVVATVTQTTAAVGSAMEVGTRLGGAMAEREAIQSQAELKRLDNEEFWMRQGSKKDSENAKIAAEQAADAAQAASWAIASQG